MLTLSLYTISDGKGNRWLNKTLHAIHGSPMLKMSVLIIDACYVKGSTFSPNISHLGQVMI